MAKPIVFNYQDYEKLLAENEQLKECIKELTKICTELKNILWDQMEIIDGTDES